MASNLFITNKEKKLGDRLRELIGLSRELRVLVGFFYFSGIKALHEALMANKTIKLRLLVGLEAEEHCGRIAEYVRETPEAEGDRDIQNAYLKSLRESFRSKAMDTPSFYERAGCFIDLLRAGRLELRKTKEPNHAKMYLFDIKDEHAALRERTWITGSSNLTLPGLEGQGELNVELSDFGGDQAAAYFEELWKESVPLTDRPEVKDEIIRIIEEESLLAQPTPFEAYALVLKNYLEHRRQLDKKARIEHIMKEAGYTPYAHQIDAVNQALATLDAYNGVIIADVVGLGKSVVGSLIGYMRRKRGIVIAPPGLVGDGDETTGWKGYLHEFHLDDWRVRSCGDMKSALEFVNHDQDFEMVIVDEAHRFRNQDTEDYHYLSQLCRGKEVVLLTATPFNNHPSDFFALLKLFMPTKKTSLVLDGDLAGAFKSYGMEFADIHEVLKHRGKTDEKTMAKIFKPLVRLGIDPAQYIQNPQAFIQVLRKRAKRLAEQVRQVIEPVTIRRNRIDLKTDPDYRKDVKGLPALQDPVEQFFELSKEQDRFYDRVINDVFGDDSPFHGAIYRPYQYAGGVDEDEESPEVTQQANMYKFMRRLLVRRFESSFGAFAKSLDNAIAMHGHVEDFAKRTDKVLINRTMMERLMEIDGDDEADEALAEYLAELEEEKARPRQQVYDLNGDFDRRRFMKELREDLRLLKSLREEVKKLELAANDPKAKALILGIEQVLKGQHPDVEAAKGEPIRRVIVFTEYADTIDHLRPLLEGKFGGKVLTVGRGAVSRSIDETVKANFDASVPARKQKSEYQILLATDKMSEGYNLNRAGLVINYDIPWNPTRVIQRVGRINRIGQRVFEKLYLFNFFPTVRGADIYKCREIAGHKMFAIHETIGEDARIFNVDETPTASSLYQKLTKNPDDLEQESFQTQAKKAYLRIVKDHPDIVRRLEKFPNRVKTAAPARQDGLYVFRRKGQAIFALRHQDGAIGEVTMESALGAIECPHGTKALPFGPGFWDRYEALCRFTRQEDHVAASGATAFDTKARMRLQEALDRTLLPGHKDFLDTLLEDLQYYGTLSDRTLRKIFQIDLGTASGVEKMRKLLDTLIAEMGRDYLDPHRKQSAEDEIIIGIEQRANELGKKRKIGLERI